MPKLSNVQKKDKTIKVEVPFEDGEVVTLIAYPNRITGARRKEMLALDGMTDDDMPDALDDKGKPILDEDGEPVKAYTVSQRAAELLFDVIQKWDLEDDDGSILPFDENTADLLAVPTQVALYTAIGEATNPKPKTSRR